MAIEPASGIWMEIKRFLPLLRAKERRRLYWVLVAITLMGLIDVLGVSSVLPFMAVLAKPDVVQSVHLLRVTYEFFGFSSPNAFLFFLGAVALLTITLTNIFALVVSWAILRFCYLLGHGLSERLLDGYLSKPYAFFLGRNSSELMLNVMGEVNGVVHGVLVPGMQSLAKCAVAACVLAFVVVIQPVLALTFAAILGGAYFALFHYVRGRVSLLGSLSQEANRARYRLSTEIFSGIKDLRLLGREGMYVDRIKAASRAYAMNQSSSELIGMTPRYALETIAFGAVLVLVLYLLAVKHEMTHVLPFLTVYAFAVYRLLPAFQQVFSSVTKIRFNLAALTLVTRELEHLERSETGKLKLMGLPISLAPFERAVRMEHIVYRYEGREDRAVDGVSLTIEKNTTIGLVGESGSGKTTLVDILLGLLEPDEGRLIVDDQIISMQEMRGWQAQLGYVPQQIFLSDDTIARNIAFGLPESEIDRARVKEAACLANLHEFIQDQLPLGYDTTVGERGIRLSGGQRQRIGIARALYHDPSVLVLDEATSALDGITEDAIIDAIRTLAHRKTIILIAHRFATVKDCDKIYLLERGRLTDEGSYKDLLARNEQFKAMAKVDAGG
ncbi:MAG: ABC transporter ATP-binding protein [Nitrospira sp.]|nr:ABC transporter ATP-binding protein [Nitrospira sp.]